MKTKYIYIYLMAWVAYFIALVGPAIVMKYDPNFPSDSLIWHGYYVFGFGWAGLLIGQYAWYANISLLAAIISINMQKYEAGITFSGVGFLIGLQTLCFDRYVRDEGGTKFFVDYVGSGFYFWELSFLLFLIYCWISSRQKTVDVAQNKLISRISLIAFLLVMLVVYIGNKLS